MEDGSELFSLEEFINNFKLERFSLGGPVFDTKKLLWLNGRYLREKRTEQEFVKYLQDQLFNNNYLSQIAPLVRERVEKSEDFIEYADFFFTAHVHADPAKFFTRGIECFRKVPIL